MTVLRLIIKAQKVSGGPISGNFLPFPQIVVLILSILAYEIVCVCVCVLVAQSCMNLCDSMNHSLPGSPVLGIFQEPYWSVIFLTQGLNPSLLHCR